MHQQRILTLRGWNKEHASDESKGLVRGGF